MMKAKLAFGVVTAFASTFALTAAASAGPTPVFTCPAGADCINLGTYPSPSSNAYFFRTNGTNPADPYIVTSYGDAPTGSSFDDIFVFETLANGKGSGSFSTSFTDPADQLSNIQVLINGTSYATTVSTGGTTLSVNDIPITALTPDTIEIKGDVAGAGSSFDGTATFMAVSEAPELSTWALLLTGLGLAGLALRRRSSLLNLA